MEARRYAAAMNRSTWLAILGAALLAGICALVFRKSDDARIRAQLRALAGAVHAEAGENEILRARRIQSTFARVFDQLGPLSQRER